MRDCFQRFVIPSACSYTARMIANVPSKANRIQESAGRWFGLIVFSGMTLRTASAMPSLEGPAIVIARWALLTALFFLFTVAYLRRQPANALASRPVEILLPLLVIVLPSFQTGPPQAVLELIHNSEALTSLVSELFRPVGIGIGYIASASGMALGEAFAVYSMLYLGRSFSLFAEARTLVTGGPYRFVRHPLYLGELVAIWSYSLAYPSRWSIGVTLLFTALQIWRAKVEEGKLLQNYPEYATLRKKTGFLWPKFVTQHLSTDS